MKNIIIIVIDALSKWYIDQHKNENSFFKYLEKEGYCADNMYSTGPFTEAAVRGFGLQTMLLEEKIIWSRMILEKKQCIKHSEI